MQLPTLENIRIRSSVDAQKIFYAVEKGILNMVTKRLDVDERIALKPGNIYVWEERGPHSEVTGLGIERFTEGRRWSPSRVREDFLFYYEKYAPPPNHPDGPKAPRDWEGLVKQTYSVFKDNDRIRKKWHLTAYFGSNSVDNLNVLDNIIPIASLEVPAGHYKSTRAVKPRKKLEKEDKKGSTDDNSSVVRTYAPYPPGGSSSEAPSSPVGMYSPYSDSGRSRQGPTNPYPIIGSPSMQTAPYSSSIASPSASSPAAGSPTYSNDIMSSAHPYTSSPSNSTSSNSFGEQRAVESLYPFLPPHHSSSSSSSSSQAHSPISSQSLYPTTVNGDPVNPTPPTPSFYHHYQPCMPQQQIPTQYNRRNALPMVHTTTIAGGSGGGGGGGGSTSQLRCHPFSSNDGTPSPRTEFPSPVSPTPSSHSSSASSYNNPGYETTVPRDYQHGVGVGGGGGGNGVVVDRGLVPLTILQSVTQTATYRRLPTEDLQLQRIERGKEERRRRREASRESPEWDEEEEEEEEG